jgi:hypothetical protein
MTQKRNINEKQYEEKRTLNTEKQIV